MPVALAVAEVVRFFAYVPSPRYRTILISEAVSLQVTGIDSARMVIRVRQGKGRKDRETVLKPSTAGGAAGLVADGPARHVANRTGGPMDASGVLSGLPTHLETKNFCAF